MPIVENVFLKFNSILEGDGADEIFNVGAEIDRIEQKTVDLLDPFVQQIKSSNKALAEATDIRKGLLILNQKIAAAQLAYTKTITKTKGIEDSIKRQEEERVIRLNRIKRLEGQIATAQGKRKRELRDQLSIQEALAKADIKYIKDKKVELDDVLEAQKNIRKEAETAASVIIKSGGKVTDPTPRTSGGISKGGGVLDSFKERVGDVADAFGDMADVLGAGGAGGSGGGAGGGGGGATVIGKLGRLAGRLGALGAVIGGIGFVINQAQANFQSIGDKGQVLKAQAGGFGKGIIRGAIQEGRRFLISNASFDPRNILSAGRAGAEIEGDFAKGLIAIRKTALAQENDLLEVIAKQRDISSDLRNSTEDRRAAVEGSFEAQRKLLDNEEKLAELQLKIIRDKRIREEGQVGRENVSAELLQQEKDALNTLDRIRSSKIGLDRSELNELTKIAIESNASNFNDAVAEIIKEFGIGTLSNFQIGVADIARRRADVNVRLAAGQIDQAQADKELAELGEEEIAQTKEYQGVLDTLQSRLKQNDILNSTYATRRLRDLKAEEESIKDTIKRIQDKIDISKDEFDIANLQAEKRNEERKLSDNDRSQQAEDVRARLAEDVLYTESVILNTRERNQIINRLNREASIEFLKIEQSKYKESEAEYKDYAARIEAATRENIRQNRQDALDNAQAISDVNLSNEIISSRVNASGFSPSDRAAQRRQRDRESLLRIRARRRDLERSQESDLDALRERREEIDERRAEILALERSRQITPEQRDEELANLRVSENTAQREFDERSAGRLLEASQLNQSEAGLREAKSPLLRLFGFDRQGNNGLNAELEDEFDNAYKSLVNFGELFLAEAARQADVFVQIQERRVDTAARLFQRGNSDLINSEEAKLDTLTEAREKAVQKQRQLSAIQVAANQAVSISNTFVALTDALGKGFPASLVAFPLILGLVGQASSFALGLSSSFGDIPAFFKGTDKDVRSTLGQPHMRGRDGYIIRADGSEKILAGQYASQVSHMDQATLVANALAGERAKMFKGYGVAYTDEVNAAMEKYGGRNRQDDKMYREIVKMNDYLSNLKMDVRVDKDGFMASMQKRVNNINRIKRRKA